MIKINYSKNIDIKNDNKINSKKPKSIKSQDTKKNNNKLYNDINNPDFKKNILYDEKVYENYINIINQLRKQ